MKLRVDASAVFLLSFPLNLNLNRINSSSSPSVEQTGCVIVSIPLITKRVIRGEAALKSLSVPAALGGLQVILGSCQVRRHRQAAHSLQTHLAAGYSPVQQVSITGMSELLHRDILNEYDEGQ